MDAVEHMGGGDVGHVEGRVLPQQHHVHGGEIDPLRFSHGDMVAVDVADLDRLRRRHHGAVPHGQPVRGVVQEPVFAPLRLQQHGKGRIARILMRWMGSIWTATFSFILWIRFFGHTSRLSLWGGVEGCQETAW